MHNHTRLLLLVLLMAFTYPFVAAHGDDKPDDFVLATVVTKARKAYVGELITDSQGLVEISDIKTGEVQKFQQSSLLTVRAGISEKSAIHSVGLPSFVAWRTARAMEIALIPGKIIKVDEGAAYVSVGGHHHVVRGNRFEVVRLGEGIGDPITGKEVGQQRQKVAEIQITDVQDDYSVAEVLGEPPIELRVGDVAERVLPSEAIAILPAVDDAGDEPAEIKRLFGDLTEKLLARDVQIVDRRLLPRVLDELSLQQSELFDPERAKSVGEHLGAYAVLTGTIIPVRDTSRRGSRSRSGKSSYYGDLQLRLIEIATGRVIFAITHRIKLEKRTTREPDAPADASARRPLPRGDGNGLPAAGNRVQPQPMPQNKAIEGNLLVNREMRVRQRVRGSIKVVNGGALTFQEVCEGDILVEKGGSAVVQGIISGRAINRGGTLEIQGIVGIGVVDEGGITKIHKGSVIAGVRQ